MGDRPTLTLPVSRACCAARAAWSAWRRASCASRKKATPASVGVTPQTGVELADVSALKRVIGTGDAPGNRQLAGQPVLWEIEVVNAGPATATNVAVTDVFDSAFNASPADYSLSTLPGSASFGSCNVVATSSHLALDNCVIASLPACTPGLDCPRIRVSARDVPGTLARITATSDYAALSGCDLIVEAVFEDPKVKAEVTAKVEAAVGTDCIFATNTSTLPISGLAKASQRPANFIGIHFFSPVDKMKLVEIIRGKQTDDETVARAFDYVQALGKVPIVVNDSRGFYTSRTFGTFVMEGAAMLGEGIPAPVIENLAMQVGMPVGPLAVLDETALSLSVHVLDQTREDFAKEGKTHTSTPGELLVERMVKELKRPGRAAGGGFYDYPAGQKKVLWPELKTRFEKADVAYSQQDIKDRLLYRQAVETARCLQEGVLTSVHDGNIGSIFGIGFPAWTGGALQFIYGQGVDAFAKRCAELAALYGGGFALTADVIASLKQHQPVY